MSEPPPGFRWENPYGWGWVLRRKEGFMAEAETEKGEVKELPILPPDKRKWPCPNCGKLIGEHAEGTLSRCYLIAILEGVLGKGIGWRVYGEIDDEPLVIGEMR
jgi:hypothetical protein